MYQILFIFGLIVTVVGAIAVSAISWVSPRGAEKLEGIVFKVLLYGLFGSVVGIVLAAVIGLFGVFLAKHENITLTLARRYAGYDTTSISSRLTVSGAAAVIVSAAIYVGTIACIIFVRGLRANSIYFPAGLWNEAFSEANPRFGPFLITMLLAFVGNVLIAYWIDDHAGKVIRGTSIRPALLQLCSRLAGYLFLIVLLSFFSLIVIQPPEGITLYDVYFRFMMSLFMAFRFPVDVLIGFSSDPLYILTYLRNELGAANGNLYLLVDAYPKFFVLAAILYGAFSLPKILFEEQ